jgi:hypothetical protein
MNASILLARLIGPFIVVIGIAVVFNMKVFRKVIDDFFKNAGLLYLSGLFSFAAGLTVVLFHNIWTADWRVIITVLGWIMLLKGICLIVFPSTIDRFSGIWMKNINVVKIPWAVLILIGLFLMCRGYNLCCAL